MSKGKRLFIALEVRILCSCPSVSWRLLLWGWWVPGWYGCAVVQLCGWPSWLQRSEYSNSSPIPKKELLPGPQLGWFSNQPRFLPTSLPSPMHPTNAVLRSWFHGGWPSNMLPSWFCCHWFCTLEFEQKRDEIKVRGVDVTKIVGYLITVSCFLFNVFSMCFCWVWCLEKHGQILYRQNFDVVTAKENSYPASLQAIYWCNMYCQQACGFFMFGQKFDCKDR